MLKLKIKHFRPRAALQLIKEYIYSSIRSLNTGRLFNDVRYFCLFVGYPRSGHTLVGSLLDAHRHAVIGLELDVLRYIQFGFRREQIFLLLLENALLAANHGRQKSGYSYYVPNQWQGRFEQIYVIGDKRGGDSSRRLAKNFNLLTRLQQVVRVPLKVVHVVRNPYDNIATMFMRNDAVSIDEAIDTYFNMASTVEQVQLSLNSDSFITVYHEDIVLNPIVELEKICNFLNLNAYEDYLRDCASIVFKNVNRSSLNIIWTDEQYKNVASLCRQYKFLDRYVDEGFKSKS